SREPALPRVRLRLPPLAAPAPLGRRDAHAVDGGVRLRDRRLQGDTIPPGLPARPAAPAEAFTAPAARTAQAARADPPPYLYRPPGLTPGPGLALEPGPTLEPEPLMDPAVRRRTNRTPKYIAQATIAKARSGRA